jgi:methionyl aminopeptidase
MTFTIEPMINAGKRDIRQLADGWTIVTADHSLSAQWEHTVLVTGRRLRGCSPPPPAPPAPGLRREAPPRNAAAG